MNTTDILSPSFGINSYFKERNLKPLQIWKVEHQNLHWRILAPLGEKCNFFGSLANWDLKFEIRPTSYILLCDIHHIKSVLTTYHSPEYNYCILPDLASKNKNFLINFWCISLNDQTCDSNHFIIAKILAWLWLICWVILASHLWVFDKHNTSPKFLPNASTLRWKLPLRDWGSCIWGSQGLRGLSYF